MENAIVYDNLEEITKIELRQLVFLAISSGITMLQSGAETYRVEDTIERFCNSHKDIDAADCFVIPTGIFLSIRYKKNPIFYFRRVKSSYTHLYKVDKVNQLSRDYVAGNITLDEGFEILDEIDSTTIYSTLKVISYSSLAASAFTGLFGGRPIDMIISFIVSFMTLAILEFVETLSLVIFIEYFVGGILIAFLSFLSTKFVGSFLDMDNIIIGTLMPLLPGYALTNSMRDLMSRDYVSGLSRMVEAILLAISLALGVGAVLQII